MDQRRIIAKTILIGRRLSMLKEFRIVLMTFQSYLKWTKEGLLRKSIPIDWLRKAFFRVDFQC